MRSCHLFLTLIWTVLTLVSCGRPESLTKEQLTAYILDEDNGLRKVLNIGTARVEVSYQPTDLMISRELPASKIPDEAIIEQLRKKYQSNLYFVVSLSRNGKEILHQVDQFQYSELVRKMSFEMSEYVFLTNSLDTLHVRDFMLDRTFGMTASTNLLFAFENRDFAQHDDFEFCIEEFGLDLGKVKLTFDPEDIRLAPRLIW